MTIKQQGGIFGRNPSFNDVEANDIDAETLKLGNLTNGRVALSGVDGLVTDNSTLTYDNLNAQVAGGTSRGGFVAKSDLNIAGLYMKTATATNRGASAEFLAHNDFYNSVGWRVSNSSDIHGDWNLHFGVSGATSDYSAISYTDVAYFNANGLAFPNGKGIDFSATSGTGTSELFDDYEEGTWTPSVTIGGGTAGIIVQAAAGKYTKVGRVVHAQFYLYFSYTSGSSGNVIFNGLPFAAAPTAGFDDVGNGFASANWTGISGAPIFTVIQNTTTLSIGYTGTGVTTQMTDANCTSNYCGGSFSFSYIAS